MQILIHAKWRLVLDAQKLLQAKKKFSYARNLKRMKFVPLRFIINL